MATKKKYIDKIKYELVELPSEFRDFYIGGQLRLGFLKIKQGSYKAAVESLKNHLKDRWMTSQQKNTLYQAKTFSEIFSLVGLKCSESGDSIELIPIYRDRLHKSLYDAESGTLMFSLLSSLDNDSVIGVSESDEYEEDEAIQFSEYRVKDGNLVSSTCNMVLQDDDRYMLGKPFIEVWKSCPTCKATTSNSFKSCPSCGSPI